MRAPTRLHRRASVAPALASQTVLPLILDLEIDLAAFERSRQQHATGTRGGAENARIALGQTEFVRHIRAAHGEQPCLADVRRDAEVPRVVRTELLQS